MERMYKILAIFFTGLLTLSSCNDKDDYYARPSWLESPVYQLLEEKGNFNYFLAAIDRTLYARILKANGNYTVFAPNDAAFEKYFEEIGISSLDEFTDEQLTAFVGYSMVYNKFTSSHLGDVLASGVWTPGASIKKMTTYYKTIYRGEIEGVEQWLVDSATDITQVATPYKYYPVFTQSYFDGLDLKSIDYEAFFPNSTFTGLNALAGKVVNADMYAENGIVHEIEAVNFPPQNLDEMLSRESSSEFKKVIETKVGTGYLFVSYIQGEGATEVYRKLYPDRDIPAVYYKTYVDLPFALNNEDFSGTATTEEDGYTLFIPTNEAVTEFVDMLTSRTGVSSIAALSQDIIGYFIKGHMVEGMAFPSRFRSLRNTMDETINQGGMFGKDFLDLGILHSEIASNGIMYSIGKVLESKYFNTVYSEFMLNPACAEILYPALTSQLATTLAVELMKSRVTGDVDEQYIVLLPSDELLAADGFTNNNGTFANSQWMTGSNVSVADRLKRLISMSIFKRTRNGNYDTYSYMEDLDGAAGFDGYGYAVNYYGDMVRFKDGKVQAVGNMMDDEWVTPTKVTGFEYNNGQVYTIDRLLQYSPRNSQSSTTAGWSEKTIYECLQDYVAQNPSSSLFLDYVDYLFPPGAEPGFMDNFSSSSFQTILVPANDVVLRAVSNGHLPPLATANTEEHRNMIERFVFSSILSGMVIPDDGLPVIEPSGTTAVNLTTNFQVSVSRYSIYDYKPTVTANKSGGTLVFRPQSVTAGTQTVIEGVGEASIIRQPGVSNFMGPRLVIHGVDDYLTFVVNG